MIVTVDEYKTLTGDKSNNTTLLTDCLAAAQEKAEERLGYALEVADYTFTHVYTFSRIFNLGIYQVNSITSVTVDGTLIDPSLYNLEHYFLTLDDSVSLSYGSVVVIQFNGGWIGNTNSDSSDGTLPSSIRMGVVLIAQALSKNMGTAAGYAASANFGDGNMTFDQTRYYKFYDLIDPYKVVRM